MKYLKIKLVFFILLILSLFNLYVYATDDVVLTDTQEVSQKTIMDIIDNWQEYSDEELNDIIANSDDKDVAYFLCSLSNDEFEKILKKDTMLNNEITFYEPVETEDNDSINTEQKIKKTEIYWEYLLGLASTPQANSVITTTKTGYFFIQIQGDGKTTKRKVQITINNTDLANQQTISFSEVAVSGYSDNHQFTLKTASSKTQLASKSSSRSYYEIAVLQFSYKKTAHYKASGDYNGKCSGYRFNFGKYSLANDGESTVNNTGHNETDTTETIDTQINLLNCGFWKDEDDKSYHATGIINLSLYYGGLKVNPNGGTWNNTTSTSSFTAKCTTTKSIANPTRTGYSFTGWSVSNGSNADGSINRNTSGSTINSSGCTFTYCGSSSSAPTSGSYFTTLKANWKINSYTVTCIDVIGTSSSGTRLGTSTWSANYGTTVYGSSKGNSTSVGAYYTGYYYTGCSSATVGTNGATVYRYFSPGNYTVTCIDVIGTSSSGAILGSSTWKANYGTTVYGSSKGSSTSVGAYYINYYYMGCSSATVTTNGATVYRYFNKNKELKLPETGEKTKLKFYIIGIGLITYSIFLIKLKKERSSE